MNFLFPRINKTLSSVKSIDFGLSKMYNSHVILKPAFITNNKRW